MILKKILKKFFKSQPNISKTSVEEKKKYEVMSGTILSGTNNIGDFTYIGFNSNITESSIGRFCSIANNVSIGIGEHRISRVSTSSIFYENPFKTLTNKECSIGNDVWVGSNSVIRRGVTVGNGAIIGANSFVNKDVKDFEIVGGVPAKHIRMRFDKEAIAILNKHQWWNYDLDKAKSKIKIIEESGLFEKEELTNK